MFSRVSSNPLQANLRANANVEKVLLSMVCLINFNGFLSSRNDWDFLLDLRNHDFTFGNKDLGILVCK